MRAGHYVHTKCYIFTLKRASNKYFTHTLAMLSRHWL